MEAEGGVTEAEAENMEIEEGVTEVDGGVMEADIEEATEAEGGVMEVDGGVMEADIEEATEAEGGVTEPQEVKRLWTVKEGLWKVKKLLERWSVWLDIILSINYEAS
ncbi:hypothetical protein R1flu_025086 [Riccia fluitans]|uniref:Uncharacterized protein n=1 Tax=Riccia fluitans TaxID=41844 RepID=A0ABD1XX67_9MARC